MSKNKQMAKLSKVLIFRRFCNLIYTNLYNFVPLLANPIAP